MTGMQSGFRTIGCFFVVPVLLLSILFPVWTPAAWCAESEYFGTYSGNFTGDDNGVWVAVIASTASDSVFLSYSTDTGQGDGGYITFAGEDPTSADYTSVSLMNDTAINATIVKADKSVLGTWSNPHSGDIGTLTGGAITSVPQAGDYAGTFSGDDSGTWTMAIAANGYISGTMTNIEGTATFEGGCHPDGYVIGVGTDPEGYDFAFSGRFSDSSISGTWVSEDGSEGEFTTLGGSTSGSSSGGGGGGGGGGCFILSLTGE